MSPLQKLPKHVGDLGKLIVAKVAQSPRVAENVGDLGKMIVATCYEKLPKMQKIAQTVTLRTYLVDGVPIMKIGKCPHVGHVSKIDLKCGVGDLNGANSMSKGKL